MSFESLVCKLEWRLWVVLCDEASSALDSRTCERLAGCGFGRSCKDVLGAWSTPLAALAQVNDCWL